MGDMTPHFSRREFTCKCGCNTNIVAAELVNKLEKVYEYLSETAEGVTAIIVTSGCRCPKHSELVGGSRTDAHTKGIAADVYAVKKDGTRWGAFSLAAVAEKIGFTGIGIIDNTAVHMDIRNNSNYVNPHWFGNEMTGDNNVKSFSQYLPKAKTTAGTPTTKKHKLVITLDGVKITEKEFD